MSKSIPFSLSELEELRAKYDTPYYLYDGNNLKSHAMFYMKTFKKYFPNFRQFFAVKANPNPSILELLASCDMDFDCSSREEINVVNMISNYTFKTSNIMFTSNYTSISDVAYALKSGCIINLDDIDGFYNLLFTKSILPEIISFRYNPVLNNNNFNKVDIKSNNFAGSETKFGMGFNNIINAYKIAKEKGIQHFGIHTMCASNQLDIYYWENLIDVIFFLVNYLHKSLGITIEFINIGGGLGIPYKTNEKQINLLRFVQLLRKTFDYNINKYNLNFEPILYTECGRYITGPYGYLVSSCKSIKKIDNNIFYGLDANMANLMRPGMYEAYHHISIPRLNNSCDFIETNVVGTLCENNDWFAKKRLLPKDIKKDDLFVIHDVGAHGFSMGFNYNSKLRSCELLKNGIDTYCVRESETFYNLFGNTLIYKKINNNNILIIVFLLLFVLFLIKYLYHLIYIL